MTDRPDGRSRNGHSGRLELVDARELPTGDLLGVLEPYAGPLDREGFRERCSRFGSAEEMTRALLAEHATGERGEEERAWNALRALWERWAPDVPFFERFDDAMLRGWNADDSVARCEIWLEAWLDVVRIADRLDLATVEELDDRFQGCEFVFNWVQDVETELLNAGADDPRFARERIRFCEEFLARFPGVGPLVVETMRRAIADAHFQAGDAAAGDRLYREWLEADPSWGWGWIGWSDAHGSFAARAHGAPDLGRAAEILERGYAVDELRDREYLLERLAEVYGDLGRGEDARRVRHELRKLGQSPRVRTSAERLGDRGVHVRHTIDFGEEGLPLERLSDLQAALTGRGGAAPSSRKIGRNEPCPCGSGMKYKKCCGGPGAAASPP